MPVALYSHPMVQVANILLSCARLVLVGVDQLPHGKLARETARRFNRNFKPIIPEPKALVGRVPRLLGTDGDAKMSKPRHNTIDLKDGADAVAKKVCATYAGPPRGAQEPGNVEANRVFGYLDADSDAAEASDLKERYERHDVSHAELKDRLTRVLNELLEPIRQRRAQCECNMARMREALEHGTGRTRAIARETMEMVHGALDLDHPRKSR